MERLPEDIELVDLGKGSRWDFPKLIYKLALLIRSVDPDLILCKLDYTNIVTAAARTVSGRRAALILGEETNVSEHLKHARLTQSRLALLRWAHHRADVIVTPSRGVAEALHEDRLIGDTPTIAIPNMVDIPNINRLAREPLSSPAQYPAKAPLIAVVGRLSEAKGHEYLLEAFAQIQHKTSSHLLIVGDGEKRTRLMVLAGRLGITHAVTFAGFQQNPFPYIAASNILVLPSLWEGFGTVLIEALALGTPVVATRAPYGPEEIIEHGRTGWLVEAGSVEDLATGVVRVLKDSALCDKFSKLGRAAAEKFAAPKIVDRFEDLFLQAADARAHRRAQMKVSSPVTSASADHLSPRLLPNPKSDTENH